MGNHSNTPRSGTAALVERVAAKLAASIEREQGDAVPAGFVSAVAADAVNLFDCKLEQQIVARASEQVRQVRNEEAFDQKVSSIRQLRLKINPVLRHQGKSSFRMNGKYRGNSAAGAS